MKWLFLKSFKIKLSCSLMFAPVANTGNFYVHKIKGTPQYHTTSHNGWNSLINGHWKETFPNINVFTWINKFDLSQLPSLGNWSNVPSKKYKNRFTIACLDLRCSINSIVASITGHSEIKLELKHALNAVRSKIFLQAWWNMRNFYLARLTLWFSFFALYNFLKQDEILSNNLVQRRRWSLWLCCKRCKW